MALRELFVEALTWHGVKNDLEQYMYVYIYIYMYTWVMPPGVLRCAHLFGDRDLLCILVMRFARARCSSLGSFPEHLEAGVGAV